LAAAPIAFIIHDDHVMGHPIVAALYDRMLAASEQAGLAQRREELLADLSGEILEIGGGTGLNLSHYPGTVKRLVVVEPDAHMARRLREKLADLRAGIDAEVVETSAEALPFADDSFDAVVSTLVLCTVDSPQRVLEEIRRVLRPGAELHLIEHVRDPQNAKRARWQDRLERPWGWVAGSCHPNRDTRATLEAAGFETSAITDGKLRKAAPLVRPLISGSARPDSG
jgi:ubiquinone/menaquinone biosynthesis C-methylase UbiE